MLNLKEALKQKYENVEREIILEGADLITQNGYTLVPNFVLNSKVLSGRAKLVYAIMLSYAYGGKAAIFPGQERLAKQCGSSPRSVWSAIRELQKGGYISVIRRGMTKTNVYVLHVKKLSTESKE